MTILILGDFEDEHATHMLRLLPTRGEDAALIDSRWFPSRLAIWFDPLSGDGEFALPDGRSVGFDQVSAVYWRNYHGILGPQLPDDQQTFIAENDARSLFESVLLRLPVRWVNGFDAYRFHQTKGAQLATVAELGIKVPPTVLTNSPEAVVDFRRYHTQAVYKPVQGGAHTRRLTDEMATPEQLRHLALAPVTIQEEIPGTNVRVFVAGARIAACEIESESVDFRDDEQPTLRVHQLSDEMQSQCRQIAQALQLRWTGIDFRRTPGGEYFFLEANPSPMFLGFEEATGLPLAEMLAEELTSQSQS